MNWEIALAIVATSVSVLAALVQLIAQWRSSRVFETEYIEVIAEPISPDTLSSVEADLVPTVETTLREAGREELLAEGDIQVMAERTFPSDDVVVVLFRLASPVALATYQEIVLPALKERFQVLQRRRRRKSGRNS